MAIGSQCVAASPLSDDPFVLTCIFVIAKLRAAATPAGNQIQKLSDQD